jgi:hypothetical protein
MGGDMERWDSDRMTDRKKEKLMIQRGAYHPSECIGLAQ